MSSDIKYRAIGVKERATSNGLQGVVKLLFIWSEEKSTWGLPNDDLFPSKRCFITKDYTNDIDQKYRSNQLFILKNVNENIFEPDKQKNAHNNAEWRCYSEDNERIRDNEFIPVIKGDLPDQGYGELETDIDIDGVQYLFIENDGFVYGPFQIFKSEKIIAKPYKTPSINVENHHIIKVSKESLIENELYLSANLDGDYTYIISFSLLNEKLKNSWEKIDYINNDSLLKEVLSSAKKGEKQTIRSRQEISKLQDDIKEAYGKNSQQERVKRALDLLSVAENNVDSQIKEFELLINEWIGSGKGKAYVSKLTSERDVLEQKKEGLIGEVDELQKTLSSQRDLLAKNQNILIDLKSQINEMENQKIIIGEDQKRKSLEDSDQAYKAREEELKAIEDSLKNKKYELDKINLHLGLTEEYESLVKKTEIQKGVAQTFEDSAKNTKIFWKTRAT